MLAFKEAYAVMMAPFLGSWSLMRQPTAGMAVTPRCCG
jgi:hypothetical protein